MSIETQRTIWSDAAVNRKDRMVRYLVPKWLACLDAVGATEGKHILDAGCGSGELGEYALARGCKVTGLDLSPRMIELCRANPALQGATYHEGSIDALPFADATFDGAIAAMSMHFCDDVPRAASELRRVLRPGGRVAISAPYGRGLDVLAVFDLALEMLPPERHDDIGRPLMFAGDGTLAALLGKVGFIDIVETVADAPLEATTFAEIWELQKTWAPVKLAASIVGEDTFLAAYQARLLEKVGKRDPARLEMKFRVVSGRKSQS